MGVAVMVSTSTWLRMALICSLWFTPKRCSSSMIRRPKSLNFTSFPSRAWVPTTMSSSPVARAFFTLSRSLGVWKRERQPTVTGKAANRSLMVAKCCWARMVVGARSAACFPSWTALKAARMATSVLP